MRGIPRIFQTKQDVYNVHRLAMSNKLDKKEWKSYLIQLTQPTRYVLPIFKVESNCFYIPYTDLPLPEEYKNNKLVYGFESDAMVPVNPITPPSSSDDVIDMQPDGNNVYTPDFSGGPEYNPNYQPPQSASSSELMMLKIYASIDPSMNQLVIYHRCPFFEMTNFTQEEIDVLLKELI